MNLQSLNKRKSEKGFTIVELLIVIVVIAILAAITIVAYGGIQNRAKTNAGQSLASSVAKKVEAYNVVKSAYPTYAELTGSTVPEATVPTDEIVSITTNTVAAADTAATDKVKAGKAVVYFSEASGSTTKPTIYYWDSTASTATSKKFDF